MSLPQTSLEEAYGGKAFGSRTPIRDAPSEPPRKRVEPQVSVSAQAAAESLIASLPLAPTTAPAQEGFRLRAEQPAPVEKRLAVRETFGERSGADEEKISRILRLIEQNRTGYERPVVQDMVLYVFTGVFFLFTFDTFVLMGKTMRKVQRT